MAAGDSSKLDREIKQRRRDMERLAAMPEFKRFLWRVIQEAKIFDRAPTDGSEGAVHAQVARRNLGLAILEMVEEGQPKSHPQGVPILTLIQTLLEEANPQAQPKDTSERDDDEELDTRYDRTTELNLDD
jgi:hypothetical protein